MLNFEYLLISLKFINFSFQIMTIDLFNILHFTNNFINLKDFKEFVQNIQFS